MFKLKSSKILYGLRCPHCKKEFFKLEDEIGNPYINKCKFILCPLCNKELAIGFNLDNNIDVSTIAHLLGYKVINFDHFPVIDRELKPCECENTSNVMVKRIPSMHRGYLFTCICSKCGTYSKLSYNIEATIKMWNDGRVEKLKKQEE